MPSTRSTASASPSGSRTTCWPATAPARSWRCLPTTSGTSSSPSRPACPSGGSLPRPARRRTSAMDSGLLGAQSPTNVLVNSGRFDGLPADVGGTAIVEDLMVNGQARPRCDLPPARLAGQPPAAMGHAHSSRLLRHGRHRARARRPAARCSCPTTSTTGFAGQQPAAGQRRLRQHDLPEMRQAGPARDGHHGHVRRLSLVLVALPVAATRKTGPSTASARRTGARSTSTPAARSTR